MSSNDPHPPPSDIASPGIKDEAASVTLGSPQEPQQQSQTPAGSFSEPVTNAAVPATQSGAVNTQKYDNADSTQAAGVHDSSTPIVAAEQSIRDTFATNDKPQDTTGLESTDTPVPEPLPDASDAAAKEVEGSAPSLTITLLLTTGSRHPFEIDGKYLQKRGINVESNDPFAMSVYTLKELIWKEWRQDWESQPTSPSSIRLISFGKLLDDKSPLSDCKFNKDAPNVVHMTVKPQEIVDEEDAKAAKAPYSREREASERSPGCRCIIQ
ncbi:hypothetical protein KXV89_007652 [Aspergillus fumigatus]|nr:hypothetical protein KXX30_000860 [Aspergillus fumigatus]KAH1679905.1 hypothetical protein KXX46_008011 [Aspergillus fumigatus]KAH1691174.1 hypothetical protein KXX12_009072 [Aspergillus fumigatus]KAH1700109.1 hypothetical protein KXX24_008693 [Aspergillus fumigatus]KAH1877205.1 hypothetical protein KXW95_004224 [Aspergillus fumigatus]